MLLRSKKKLLRNFTFGIEDSLVSTVGVLSGVAIAQQAKSQIILTGIILIFVEAFSMAIGSLMAEQSVDEFSAKKEISLSRELPSSLVMFFSYLFSGLIPLFPYIVFETDLAFKLSIIASLITLAALGVFNGKIARINPVKSAITMFILGGVAILAGVTIGKIF